METDATLVAVIDLGAYSARLEICQVSADGAIEILENLSHPLPLGNDVFAGGRIRAGNIRLAERVLADFRRLMQEYRVEHCKAVATSAVREALNRDIFLHRVRQYSGIAVEVLEGPAEIRLIFLAVKKALAGRFPLHQGNAVIYTIGTGSSQICFLQNGHLRSADTIRLGTLRMVESLDERISSQRLQEIVDPFVAAILGSVARMTPGSHPENLIAVGAPVRGLVQLRGRRRQAHLARMTRAQFLQVFEQVAQSSVAELVAQYRLPDVIAQSIEPCCHMLEHLFEVTGAKHMIVPMVNTRDALIADLMRDLAGRPDPFIPEIISAAESMGERYRYDAAHARKVADLALLLFAETQPLHQLPPRCRVLLEVAALVHDVGYFISSRSHHKHSYYLVRNTELPGVSSLEQQLLATTVRYHRRSLPKTAHLEYTSLAPEDRVLVSKMAALVRLADALDRAHVSKVRGLTVAISDERVLLHATGPEDLTLEGWAVQRKADMFREMFGVDVVLAGAGVS